MWIIKIVLSLSTEAEKSQRRGAQDKIVEDPSPHPICYQTMWLNSDSLRSCKAKSPPLLGYALNNNKTMFLEISVIKNTFQKEEMNKSAQRKLRTHIYSIINYWKNDWYVCIKWRSHSNSMHSSRGLGQRVEHGSPGLFWGRAEAMGQFKEVTETVWMWKITHDDEMRIANG